MAKKPKKPEWAPFGDTAPMIDSRRLGYGSGGRSAPKRVRMSMADVKRYYSPDRGFDEARDSASSAPSFAGGGMVGGGGLPAMARALGSATDSVQKDYLGPMGLDPDEWDLSYEPVQPKMKPTSGAYHPGFRGMLERVGPVLGEAFSEADWDSPYARMAARLAKAYGHHLQSGVDDRMGDITAENKQAMGAADEQNAFRRTQVSQNRASYLSTARDRLPTPQAVLEQKNAEKRAAAKESAMGRVEGTVEARVSAGLPKQGTGRTTKPKSYDPSSFKLFGDADKIQIDELDQAEKDAVAELKSMNSDYTLKQAFQPVRKINGKPVKEGPEVMAARMRKAELDKAVADARGQKRAAGKRALLWHAQNIPSDSTAALGVWRQLDRSAQSLGIDKDPEVEAALDAAAEALDRGK